MGNKRDITKTRVHSGKQIKRSEARFMIHAFDGTPDDPAVFPTEILDDFYNESKQQHFVPPYGTVLTVLPGAYNIRLSSDYSKITMHGSRIIITFDSDIQHQINGTLVYHWKDNAAYVEKITTRQGTHGYGKMLIDAMKGIVEAEQLLGIMLVSTQSATGFYAKQGFFEMSVQETLHHVHSPWANPRRWQNVQGGGPRGWMNMMQY